MVRTSTYVNGEEATYKMKLVTWRSTNPVECCRCGELIIRGAKAWRVGGGRYRHAGAIRYYCLRCGDEIQHDV